MKLNKTEAERLLNVLHAAGKMPAIGDTDVVITQSNTSGIDVTTKVSYDSLNGKVTINITDYEAW